MEKILETKISRFDGGMVNDPRDPAGNIARMVSNFDIFTFSRKMLPYRQSESGDGAASTSKKRNFAVALRTGTTYSVYSLGVVSGQVYAEVLYKNLTVSTNDLGDSAWVAPSANQSASGAPNFNLWVYYRKVNLIFGARNGSHIMAFSPTGTAFADTARAITYTEVGQGIVHSKDDILYIPFYNNAGAAGSKSFIVKNNNGTWTDSALALPDHLIPVSTCEYGNFLAIGCVPASGIGNSRIFLWDRNESATTLAESIDAGSGTLRILEQVDGELIWISQKGGTITTPGFSTLPNSTTSHRDRVYFRKLVGNVGVKFFELHSDRTGGVNTTSIPPYKQVVDNRLYFQMIIQFNGSVRDGVWSIGRSSSSAPFALVNERTSNNNTALATGDALFGFIVLGDFIIQSFGSGGSGATENVNKTVASSNTSFSANSIYESKTFDGSQADPHVDASRYKDLLEVGVFTEPMVTLGQIVLAYQTDSNVGTSTWTTVFTNTTDNSVSHVANNVESTGAQLPRQYKQIAFRILATGGAEVTGLYFKEKARGTKYITD